MAGGEATAGEEAKGATSSNEIVYFVTIGSLQNGISGGYEYEHFTRERTRTASRHHSRTKPYTRDTHVCILGYTPKVRATVRGAASASWGKQMRVYE